MPDRDPRQTATSSRGHAITRRTVLTTAIPGALALGLGASAARMPLVRAAQSGGKSVSLQFWGRLTENKQIDALVKAWNDKNPNISVKYQGLPADQYRTKLLTATAAGNAPDIVGMDVAIMPQYMDQDSLHPLDDYIAAAGADFRADFPAGLWLSATKANKTYAVPWWADPSGMFYNLDLFKKAGIDTAPETWDDLMTAAKATTETKGGPSSAVYGAVFPAIGPSVMFTWLPFLWGNGGDLLDAKNCSAFNDQAGIQAMQLWVDLFQKGYMPRSAVLGQSSDELTQLVISNRAAMYVGGSSLINYAAVNAPDVKLGTAVMPRPANGKHSSYLGGDNLVIMNKSEHPDEAWQFIQFMIEADQMRQFATANDGVWVDGMMTRTSAYSDDFYTKYPLLKPFADALKIGRTPGTPLLSQIRVPVWNNFQEAFLDKKSVEQAMKDAQAAVNKITGCTS